MRQSGRGRQNRIFGKPTKLDRLCNYAVFRPIAGTMDVQPLDSAAWNLFRLQVHASAVSAGPSWRTLLPNRDHRLDRSLTGGPRVSLGATSGHQVAPANLASVRGAGNILGTLDCVSANWRNTFEPAHGSHPGGWRRGFARLGVLLRAYGDNALHSSSPGKSVCVAASRTTQRRRPRRGEIRTLMRSPRRGLGAVLLISPAGTGAALGLLPAIVSHYGVGAAGVMWVNGAAGGLLLALGPLMGHACSRRLGSPPYL